MSKPLSHPENRTPQSLNRRQLLRYAAAASAAAAITGRAKARAEVPVTKLMLQKPTPPKDVKDRCRRAITLLRQNDPIDDGAPGMTIGRWLYEPLIDNMDWFIKNTDAYDVPSAGSKNRHKLNMKVLKPHLKELKKQLNKLPEAQKRYPLKKYYELQWPYDKDPNEPMPKKLRIAFEKVDKFCSSPHVRLDNSKRKEAKELLEDPVFSGVLYNVEANDMYQVDRNTHLKHEQTKTQPNSQYKKAREGFSKGIFTEKPDGSAFNGADAVDNDMCWSESQGKCVPAQDPSDDSYCEEDANGQPTTSSDVCP